MRPAPARSIPARVALLVALVVGATAAGTAVVSYRHAVAEAEGALARKGEAYAAIAAAELGPSPARRDAAAAQEVLEALAHDPDVAEATLSYRAGARVTTRSEGAPSPAGSTVDTEIDVGPRDGEAGRLVVRLHRISLEDARGRALRASAAGAIGVLLIGVAAALLIGASLRRRLRALTRVASAIAAGDLRGRPVKSGAGDEIDQLAHAFDAMVTRLEELLAQQARSAADEQVRLDGLVRERTNELGARHREVRRLLDHMSDGLFTIDRLGRLGTESARVLERWFGPAEPGTPFWRYLAADDDGMAGRIEMGWDAVSTDLLPLPMALDQLPRFIRSGPASLELRVEPIDDGGERPEQFLVVVRDVTLALERDAAAADARELGAALQCIASDRDGFVEQLREVDALARRVTTAREPRPEVLRDLHTLKGNAAMLGFRSVASICHEWEDRVDITQELPDAELHVRLVSRWGAIRGALAPLIHEGTHRTAVERGDVERLEEAIRAERPRSTLLSLTRALLMERAESHLSRLADYARVSAGGRGSDVRVHVKCDDVRLESSAFTSLWAALVHVVRNALSHGIEPPGDRVACGKSPIGEIRLLCSQSSGGLEISIADDGRGIDWDRVRSVAERMGVPCTTQHELERALFTPGFSTSETVSELAGRGQGLSAVLAAARDLDGTVRVSSQRGHGTKCTIVIPEGRRWLRRTASGAYCAFDPCLLPAS